METQTSSSPSPFTIAPNTNPISRSSTPSHLFLRKTLFDLSQSAQKISENLSTLLSDENSGNYNLSSASPVPQSSSSGWKVMCSESSENDLTHQPSDPTTLPVKNLSSEDTIETLRNPIINSGKFVIDYDDSFSAPASAEDASALLSEREIVLEVTSEVQSPIQGVEALVQPENEQEEQEEVSEEERLRLQREKEERESQELIWELMRQEQMELYQMQMQFMQSQANMDGLSEEDMRAIQETMSENNRVIQTIQTFTAQPEETAAEEEGEQEEGEEEEEEEEEWDYERLLALGQVLGDVKTERWRARSKQVIESLPTMTYSDIQTTAATATSSSSSSEAQDTPQHKTKKQKPSSPSAPLARSSSYFEDYRCVVCMEDFEASDVCRLLPCTHYFHLSCTAGWLSDHNSCPTCKKKVVASPEK